MPDRIIGAIGGEKAGPLVIATAALHGNEPAGVQALEIAFQMLGQIPAKQFRGRFAGFIGNLRAFKTHSRFIERDFNRIWKKDQLESMLLRKESELHGEDLEFIYLYRAIRREIQHYDPEVILLLDLHTTSAGGGIFCIPTDENASLRWARQLHAPAILNLFDRVEGTLLRFAVDGYFSSMEKNRHILGVAYEAGQHEDPQSVSRSLSAILNTLHFAGCISDKNVQNPQEKFLAESFARLPKVTRLIHAHHIHPGDAFRMRPGYANFQPVKKGEHLADDKHGQVLCPHDSLILMPLYQAQGSDGFFLVKEEESR